MKTLYENDYVTINTDTGEPTCSLDIIYHESSVVEEYNNQLKQEDQGYKFVRMKELPEQLQQKYIKFLNEES